MTKQEQEIEEVAKIFCDKDYCSDSDDNQYPGCKILKNGGCTNKSYVDQILSLINETHVRLDKKVKVRCRDVATHICDYCIREKQSCEGRANGGYITRTVGELVEGKPMEAT